MSRSLRLEARPSDIAAGFRRCDWPYDRIRIEMAKIFRERHQIVGEQAGEGGHSGIAVFERQIQSLEMSLLVLSLSIAVASNEIIAQPKMKTAIGNAER